MALIECPNCGHTISDRAAQCPHCGEAVKSHVSTSTNAPDITPQSKKGNQQNKSNKHMRLFLYILFGLMVVGGACYFFYDYHNSKNIAERTALREKGEDAADKRDYELAFKYFLQSAEMGDPKAQYNVGGYYLAGDGVERNLEEAFKWLLLSAENGCSEGQYALGYSYIQGIGTAKSEEEGLKWITKSAEGGFLTAISVLGGLYANGSPELKIEKDDAKAKFWYDRFLQINKERAEAGDSVAQYTLGYSYIQGIVTAKSGEEGLKWITKSAEGGYLDAINALGSLYANGSPELKIEKDDAKANFWKDRYFQIYKERAKAGDSEAQYAYGRLLLDGFGGNRDYDEGISWIKKSAQQGNKVASDFLIKKGI